MPATIAVSISAKIHDNWILNKSHSSYKNLVTGFTGDLPKGNFYEYIDNDRCAYIHKNTAYTFDLNTGTSTEFHKFNEEDRAIITNIDEKICIFTLTYIMLFDRSKTILKTHNPWNIVKLLGDYYAEVELMTKEKIVIINVYRNNTNVKIIEVKCYAGNSDIYEYKDEIVKTIKLIDNYIVIYCSVYELITTEGECSICLEDYNNEERITGLSSCRHYFHKKCLDDWMANNDTCPLCREHIFK